MNDEENTSSTYVENLWLTKKPKYGIFENFISFNPEESSENSDTKTIHVPRIAKHLETILLKKNDVIYTNCPDALADLVFELFNYNYQESMIENPRMIWSDKIRIENVPGGRQLIRDKIAIEDNNIASKLIDSFEGMHGFEYGLKSLSFFYVLNHITHPDNIHKYKNMTLDKVLKETDDPMLLEIYKGYHELKIVHHDYTDKIAHIAFMSRNKNTVMPFNLKHSVQDVTGINLFFDIKIDVLCQILDKSDNGVYDEYTVLCDPVFDYTVKWLFENSSFYSMSSVSAYEVNLYSELFSVLVENSYSSYEIMFDESSTVSSHILLYSMVKDNIRDIYLFLRKNGYKSKTIVEDALITVYATYLAYAIYYYESLKGTKEELEYNLTNLKMKDYNFILDFFPPKNVDDLTEVKLTKLLHAIKSYVENDEKIPFAEIVNK